VRSILIIDDDPSALRMFASALGSIASISTATSGKEGLELLETRAFDALILDLHMPNVDGHAVLESLGSPLSKNHHTPVYVATADDSTEARVQAMRRRGVFFLTKPVSIRMLVNLVETQLARAERPTTPRK
jgi:DNA-binding response OmpR family regulator